MKSIAVLTSDSEIEAEERRKSRAAFKKSKQEELVGNLYGMVWGLLVAENSP